MAHTVISTMFESFDFRVKKQNKVIPLQINQSVHDSWKIPPKTSMIDSQVDNEKKGLGQISHDIILTVNVGGQLFQVKRNTLRAGRVGILPRLTPSHESYEATSGIYFFDRNPKYFTAILDYYRTGEIHISRDFCGRQLEDELSYWGLSDDVISDCCWRRYSDLREEQCQNNRVRREFMDICQVKLARIRGLSPWKERIWVTLEDPTFSGVAKVVLMGYLFLVFVSLVNACALSYLSSQDNGRVFANLNGSDDMLGDAELSGNSKTLVVCALLYVELGCLGILAIFVIVRIVVSPYKCQFFTNMLNVIDLLYLLLSGSKSILCLHLPVTVMKIFGSMFLSITHHLTMIVGILRVFRAARHYRGVRELWYAIRASFREVWLLSIFVTIGVIIFGIVFYCAHLVSSDDAGNIFVSFWWALITMTTVGYGDVVPTAVLGYIIAAFCALVGLVMISLPIPFIAHNFNLYYGYKSRSCRKLEKFERQDIYK